MRAAGVFQFSNSRLRESGFRTDTRLTRGRRRAASLAQMGNAHRLDRLCARREFLSEFQARKCGLGFRSDAALERRVTEVGAPGEVLSDLDFVGVRRNEIGVARQRTVYHVLKH